MSALTLPAIHRGRRLALVTVAVAIAVAVAVTLLFWARTGDTTSPPKPASTTYTHPLDAHPLGPVTDASPNPWAVNDCAVLLDVLGEDAHAYGC
jgi:flagellar biosynthesis/type III secretory pathway M-ring protein FliF/YscJ